MARNKIVLSGVTVIGLADRGRAIGKDESGQVVFMDGTVPGDVLDVLVLRKKKGYYQGIPHRFIKFCKPIDRKGENCE